MALGDDAIGQAPVEPDIPMVNAGQDTNALAEEWRGWMAEPSHRSALMQFGIQLMQPVAQGQTTAGHFGQALGAGGEAAGRSLVSDRAEREQTRKELETEQRGELGALREESRAVSAGASLQNAQTKARESQHKVDMWQARAEKSAADVKRIESEIALKGASAPLQNALLEARTAEARANAAMRDERRGLYTYEAETRRLTAETGQQRATTQADQGQQRIDQVGRRLDIAQQNADALRDRYQKGDANTQARIWASWKTTTDLVNPKHPDLKLTQPEWAAKYGMGGAPTAAPTGTKPAGTKPPTAAKPDTAVDDKGVTRTWNPALGSRSDPDAWE